MKTVYSDTHKKRDAKTELYGGELADPFERPNRMTYIRNRLETADLGPILAPTDQGMDPTLAIHDAGFVDFLQTACAEWQAEGYKGEAIATCWHARRMVQRCPKHIDGKLGYYTPDALIISLGVDTFETDPISFFKLKSADFTTYGADIAALNLPTLFVMEGGYDIEEIGLNTVNVLQGFTSA